MPLFFLGLHPFALSRNSTRFLVFQHFFGLLEGPFLASPMRCIPSVRGGQSSQKYLFCCQAFFCENTTYSVVENYFALHIGKSIEFF